MRRQILSAAIALALSHVALAQQATPPPTDATVPLSYVGTNARVSAGIDDEGNFTGEGLFVFGMDADSAWLAQGWLGYAGAGGLQLDYHWLRGDGKRVWKVFGALDQNAFDDRKATVGVGIEGEHVFFDAYASGATTDERLTGTIVDVDTSVVMGSDNGRPFTQTQTITTTIDAFEQPYDWGVGARIGRWFDPALVRLRGGFDYESGDFDSDQFTVSVAVDKYIANSGHSISLELEHGFKNGEFETDGDESRAWLLWRYEFGQSFRATEPYRMVEQRRQVEVAAAPADPIVVRNEVRMDDETFFALDSSVLNEAERGALDELVATIRSDKRVSRVSVVGHTCDLGPEAYNQKLSERRAAAVRDYLVAQGVDAAEIDVSGAGELAPKYPNDGEENRRRNRRVDVGFLTVETRTETPPAQTTTESKVEWVREPVEASPAWIERALRNPAQHKRTVDVYRFEETTQETTLGPREFINRGPAANPDSATTPRDTAVTIAVLANDTDPDGDALSITSVTTPANGTAVATGTSIAYTPRAGFTGTDTFSYTVSDGRGGTATATVTVTVTAPLNNPPVAVDDFVEINANTYAIVLPLANDSDPDGDPLTITAVGTPTNGTVRINSGQTILYIPTWTWWGTETFTYTISDGRGGTATATIRIRVYDD
ncbi:MAG TPA: Ig-like domain-containing protein [Xanthomonadales bacterium]|nr:Ig-like domain-containing protein [Xanthomonadales bacterium]